MFAVLIKDFAVNTEHVFTSALPYDPARLTAFCESMLKTFGNVLRTTDISLDNGDQLYNYRLSLRMFNGSVDVILTSAGVTVAFREGHNKVALQAIGNYMVVIDTLLQGFSPQLRHATFATHAIFKTPQEYTDYMSTVANPQRGYTAGGITLHCPGNTFEGQIRVSTDKSLAYGQGLFASCQISTPEKFSKDLLAKFESRFLDVAKDLKLDLKLPE